MRSPSIAILIWSGLIALGGCGSSKAQGDGELDGGGPDASSDAVAPKTDAGAEAEAEAPDVGNGWMPRPVHAACASPVVTPGLIVDPMRTIASPRLAWGDGDAAVVYGETTTSGWSIRLQRVTEHGVAVGAFIELGSINSIAGPYTAIAGDKTKYVACWQSFNAVHVDCAEVAKGASTAKAVLSQDGRFPALAYGPGELVGSGFNFGTAFVGVIGTNTYVPIQSGLILGTAALEPTPSGYAMSVGQADLTIHRLSPGLKKKGAATTRPIPQADERSIRLAADGEQVLAAWAEQSPAQVMAALDANGALSTPKRVDDASAPMSTTTIIGAARGAGSYAVVWPSDAAGNAVWYRAVDASGTPTGVPLKIKDGANTPELMAVSDGFLLAVTESGSTKVTLAHLACP